MWTRAFSPLLLLLLAQGTFAAAPLAEGWVRGRQDFNLLSPLAGAMTEVSQIRLRALEGGVTVEYVDLETLSRSGKTEWVRLPVFRTLKREDETPWLELPLGPYSVRNVRIVGEGHRPSRVQVVSRRDLPSL